MPLEPIIVAETHGTLRKSLGVPLSVRAEQSRGPVSEPYLEAFPVPEVFFGLLVEGRLTLAECYALSVPYLSWQMVLIGDPLYRPFRRL